MADPTRLEVSYQANRGFLLGIGTNPDPEPDLDTIVISGSHSHPGFHHSHQGHMHFEGLGNPHSLIRHHLEDILNTTHSVPRIAKVSFVIDFFHILFQI
ncbi:unnamed protein product [Protopolystoma xenopodis]|uniref:Uncharacterized protein n=1 Tax=Protopolystoma xenopodis TaxID=117903 RepID=A0A448WHG0_9PLAT|nr:unnamed protein product [Protopolystoma xenopodis]